MLAQYLDVTEEYKKNGEAILELSNYDYCVVQVIGNTGDEIAFQSTLDSGAVNSVTDGNALTSINYTDIVATNLLDNTLVNIVSDGAYRVNVVGRYLRLQGLGNLNVGKLLVMLTKIS